MKVRSLLVCALVLGLLAAVSGVQGAAPSFFGYTGLVVTPTAETLGTGQFNAGLFLDSDSDSILVANLGMADALEVGFTRLNRSGDGNTWLNAKYRLSRETGTSPAFAVGVFDFTDDTTTYLVMSKSLAWQGARGSDISSPQVHLGVAGGRMDGLFAALSAALGDRMLLMAEYDTDDINLGARMALSDELRVHAAIMGGSSDFVVGISFTRR